MEQVLVNPHHLLGGMWMMTGGESGSLVPLASTMESSVRVTMEKAQGCRVVLDVGVRFCYRRGKVNVGSSIGSTGRDRSVGIV